LAEVFHRTHNLRLFQRRWNDEIGDAGSDVRRALRYITRQHWRFAAQCHKRVHKVWKDVVDTENGYDGGGRVWNCAGFDGPTGKYGPTGRWRGTIEK